MPSFSFISKSVSMAVLFISFPSFSHSPITTQSQWTPIYADLDILKRVGAPILYSDKKLNMAYTLASQNTLQAISEAAHANGRCGNFEQLSQTPESLNLVSNDFDLIEKQNQKAFQYYNLGRNVSQDLVKNPDTSASLDQLKSQNIKETVEWLSSFPTRYNRASQPNLHVEHFQIKLQQLLKSIKPNAKVELLSHRNTQQKTIRVRLTGKTRPSEVIVLGAHLDSIVGWGGAGRAPGADDNASGSASLLEALRVIAQQPETERTIEFFWYAGEESGLLGSAEIAEMYKTEKRNVIAVLQLDMTLFPGDGEFKITSIGDFTSPWLRDFLIAANNTYLGIEILNDDCGYGCSDHASWYRRGFSTLFPTEAKFNSSFKSIHTERDIINPQFSFEHSLVFAKIALLFGLELGNSELKDPMN